MNTESKSEPDRRISYVTRRLSYVSRYLEENP